jgi:hypothetical protein
MRCRRANGTERAWFATKEDAEAFAADPKNVRYRGDIPVLCTRIGCDGWHLSQPHWADALAAAARMGTLHGSRVRTRVGAAGGAIVTKHIGILIAKDGKSRLVRPANGIAFSHEEIALYCSRGHVLVEHERYMDYQQDRPELMTRERLQ